MKKEEEGIYLLGMAMVMSSEYSVFKGLTLDEMIMAMDHKIMSMTLGITFEIRELVDKGYSEEQILNMIQNIVFEEEDNVSDREAEYIKKDAKKTLKLIINNREKEND